MVPRRDLLIRRLKITGSTLAGGHGSLQNTFYIAGKAVYQINTGFVPLVQIFRLNLLALAAFEFPLLRRFKHTGCNEGAYLASYVS